MRRHPHSGDVVALINDQDPKPWGFWRWFLYVAACVALGALFGFLPRIL